MTTNPHAIPSPVRPIYWEPVAGTGERIMVGAVYGRENEYSFSKTIRSDVLTCLYGETSLGVTKLIDHTLAIIAAAANAAGSLEGMVRPINGLFPGELREIHATSAQELIQSVCLMYGSLGHIEPACDSDSESVVVEQKSRQPKFALAVRKLFVSRHTRLEKYFNQKVTFPESGRRVRFDFASPAAIVHFTTINPKSIGASIERAQSRLWELSLAKQSTRLEHVALITDTELTSYAVSSKQMMTKIQEASRSIEREADAAGLRWYAVKGAAAGAERLASLVA